jgi:anti-sigma factor RsiW
MDCRTAIDAVVRARAGALAPAERQALDAHAASCARCRAEAALAAALDVALAADPGPPPSDDFTPRVIARIRAAERRRPAVTRAPAWPARLLVRFAPAGAIAATIVGVALLGPLAGGSTLLDFLTHALPHLAPATWMTLVAGAGLAVLGTYEATSFFAES